MTSPELESPAFPSLYIFGGILVMAGLVMIGILGSRDRLGMGTKGTWLRATWPLALASSFTILGTY